ncbi:MAG: VanW family protein, partial [Abditibacteriaceae bacterium]
MQHEATPTRFSALIFRGKATLLQMRRAWQDTADGIARYPSGNIADFPFVIAETRTPLWSHNTATEWMLQAGKVQNLRCALRRLYGARIPADGTFSFWKQVGQATRRRSFAEGRLLREGCLMPAIGGGLCQLSNALYDVALQADLPIVERWGHSNIVPDSAAASGRDATIAWNYIDLRFRPTKDVLIEAFL